MMAEESRPSTVVLCDFDGTLTKVNVMDYIYTRFAACGMKFAERWERDELSTMEELRQTFATVQAKRPELEAAISKIALVPGIEEFIAFCKDRRYGFAILSEGLRWYIEYLLVLHGITGVMIYANEIFFEEEGFKFSFPWFDPRTPLRGTSKQAIIKHYHERGQRVAFVGDGRSDYEAADVADAVYGCGLLTEYCRQEGIPVVPFADLNDLMNKWREP